jgi:hypothetical protein
MAYWCHSSPWIDEALTTRPIKVLIFLSCTCRKPRFVAQCPVKFPGHQKWVALPVRVVHVEKSPSSQENPRKNQEFRFHVIPHAGRRLSRSRWDHSAKAGGAVYSRRCGPLWPAFGRSTASLSPSLQTVFGDGELRTTITRMLSP